GGEISGNFRRGKAEARLWTMYRSSRYPRGHEHHRHHHEHVHRPTNSEDDLRADAQAMGHIQPRDRRTRHSRTYSRRQTGPREIRCSGRGLGDAQSLNGWKDSGRSISIGRIALLAADGELIVAATPS